MVISPYLRAWFPYRMDPDDPLKSIAKNMVGIYCNQNLDWMIDNMVRLCREYSVDGLVCHAHYTCRPMCAPQPELMDGVARKLGIPSVFIEADHGDPSYYSDAQVDTRLQALVEMIDARRGTK